MYYNGYVLTLWGYLASLLYRTHSDQVFSSTTIANSPNLAFLLLRFIECSTFIRDSTSSRGWKHIQMPTLLTNLSNIIQASGVPTELKARAMAIRLIEKYLYHKKGELKDIWGKPVDEQGKEAALSESTEAIKLMEGISGESCVLVYLARIQVEYGTIGIRAATWDKLMAQTEHFVDREDLYGTCWALYFMAQHAVTFGDREALKKIILAVHEVKSMGLGECDAVFRRWFNKCQSWPLYKECETSIYSPPSSNELPPKSQQPSKVAPQHSQVLNEKVSQNAQSRGASFSKTLAEVAVTAAVNEVVQDSVNAIFNAL